MFFFVVVVLRFWFVGTDVSYVLGFVLHTRRARLLVVGGCGTRKKYYDVMMVQ